MFSHANRYFNHALHITLIFFDHGQVVLPVLLLLDDGILRRPTSDHILSWLVIRAATSFSRATHTLF